MQNVITIENGVTRHPLYRLKEPINLQIGKGEHVAIVGGNGAGKKRECRGAQGKKRVEGTGHNAVRK